MENQTEKKKAQWGGRRAGAGRPSANPKKHTITLRIPDDVAAILDRQEHRTEFIIEAIREYDKKQQRPG